MGRGGKRVSSPGCLAGSRVMTFGVDLRQSGSADRDGGAPVVSLSTYLLVLLFGNRANNWCRRSVDFRVRCTCSLWVARPIQSAFRSRPLNAFRLSPFTFLFTVFLLVQRGRSGVTWSG